MICTNKIHKALAPINVGEGSERLFALVPPAYDPFIVHEFDDATMAEFSDYVRDLTQRGIDTMFIHIDSFGGEVHCLEGMLELIESFRANGGKIVTYTPTKAMSCGFVLLTAGDKGSRYMGRYSSMMCHEIASGEFGKLTDLKNGIKETERMNHQIFDVLDKNTGQESGFWMKQVSDAKNADIFLTPERCMELGVADRIGTPKVTMEVGFKLFVE